MIARRAAVLSGPKAAVLFALLLLTGCATVQPEEVMPNAGPKRPGRHAVAGGDASEQRAGERATHAEQFHAVTDLRADTPLWRTLRWTNPTFNAGTSPCVDGRIPLSDLDAVRFYMDVDAAGCVPTFICERNERGREGLRDSVRLQLPGAGWLYAMAVDTLGNVSARCSWVRVP